MKVIEKIEASNGGTVFSFEFFPPKIAEGVENLFERMDRMVSHNPSFCDITWGAGGSTAELTLDIANRMQNMVLGFSPAMATEAKKKVILVSADGEHFEVDKIMAMESQLLYFMVENECAETGNATLVSENTQRNRCT